MGEGTICMTSLKYMCGKAASSKLTKKAIKIGIMESSPMVSGSVVKEFHMDQSSAGLAQ